MGKAKGMKRSGMKRSPGQEEKRIPQLRVPGKLYLRLHERALRSVSRAVSSVSVSSTLAT